MTAAHDGFTTRSLSAGVAGRAGAHAATRRTRRLARAAAHLVKDVVDRSFAALAILVLLPAVAVLMLAVRIDAPGPAIFRQQRIGKDGRTFTMFKLRTMRISAESELDGLADQNDATGALFKLRADPRVTRVGRVLRRYSMDELPQLLNVVRGEMSLVGPRPALPQEVAQYDAETLRRLTVKPGITGLWQVSGRSDLTWEESVRIDLSYVDEWSLLLDVRIMMRTFGAVLGHRGAY